jgi:cysteinyl-tRNA synthetase
LTDVIGIPTKVEDVLLDEAIEALIEERQLARKNKDFKRSDEIRELLKNKGIMLEDTREGVKYHRM